jgi:hypothetical protein
MHAAAADELGVCPPPRFFCPEQPRRRHRRACLGGAPTAWSYHPRRGLSGPRSGSRQTSVKRDHPNSGGPNCGRRPSYGANSTAGGDNSFQRSTGTWQPNPANLSQSRAAHLDLPCQICHNLAVMCHLLAGDVGQAGSSWADSCRPSLAENQGLGTSDETRKGGVSCQP